MKESTALLSAIILTLTIFYQASAQSSSVAWQAQSAPAVQSVPVWLLVLFSALAFAVCVLVIVNLRRKP